MVDVKDRALKKIRQEQLEDPFFDEKLLMYKLINEFDEEKLSLAKEYISAESFSDERNRIIFSEIEKMADEGEFIDLRSVSCRLDRISIFKNAGSYDYLKSLNNDLMRTYNDVGVWSVTCLKRIKEGYLNRQLVKIAEYLKNSNGESVTDRINKSIIDLEKVSDQENTGAIQAKSLADEYFKEKDEQYEREKNRKKNPDKSQEDVVPTGYKAIDDLLAGGLRKGDICIIGARPGIGKTTLGMNIAQNVMFAPTTKAPVLFYSLEMSIQEIRKRFVSSVASVDHNLLLRSELNDESWVQINQSAPGVRENEDRSIYCDDRSGLTPSDIKMSASKFKKHYGLSLVVIDYLQFIELPGYKNRYEAVSEISRQLKRIASSLQVPVIVLAQLNRNSENRNNKRPVLADLRESGQIEQDASIILLVHKEDDNDLQREIILAKNRHGLTGKVPLTFNGQYCRFDGVKQ